MQTRESEQPERKTVTLAERAGLGGITLCPCGVISLHLGAVSLRLEATALVELQHLVEAALDSVCEMAALNRERMATAQVQ